MIGAAALIMISVFGSFILGGSGVRWVPKWADRFLPHLDIEGTGPEGKGAGTQGQDPRAGQRRGGLDSMKL